MGAISLRGKVGESEPPYLVLPLTVEPTKPRLCHDARFLNLWMVDMPFSLDSLTHLPRYVGRDTYQTVLDDKSGYDHFLLTENAENSLGYNGEAGISSITHFRLDGKSRLMFTTLRDYWRLISFVPSVFLVHCILTTAIMANSKSHTAMALTRISRPLTPVTWLLRNLPSFWWHISLSTWVISWAFQSLS